MLSKEQVKAAIFENQLPTKTIKPFKKLSWSISLRIVKAAFPDTLEECVKILASAFIFPNESQEEKELLLKSMSCFVVDILFKKYMQFYADWTKNLNNLVENIVKSDVQSKFVWETSKCVGVDRMLHSSAHNDAQLLWIFYNLMEEKRDKNIYTNKLVEDIFEMLKPWLDKELYVRMKETEESKRENVLFDEQTEHYLEDSEGDNVEIEYMQ